MAAFKQQQVLNDAPTDWTRSVTFAQFDPAFGTLQAIDVGLTADVTGSVAIESLEAAPAEVSASLAGGVDVFSPTGAVLAAAGPAAYGSASLGSYSGDFDYAGPSGAVLALASTATANAQWLPGSIDLGDIVGTGPLILPVTTNIGLQVSGPANMVVSSTAQAGAVVNLTYQATGGSGDQDGGSAGGVITTISNTTGPTSTSAASVTTGSQTVNVADSTTGWSKSLTFNQFAPALGRLEAVNIALSGELKTTVGAENEDLGAATVMVEQAATLSLGLPGTVETATGQIDNTLLLAGYDGAADFAGASGAIVQGTTQFYAQDFQAADAADLAAFAGDTTVAVPLSALGTSTIEGPGNLLAGLWALAGATVSISYTYVPDGITDNEVVWQGFSDGEWSNGNNWSTNPAATQSTDDVAIVASNQPTITLDIAQTIHSLVIDAPDKTLVLDADLSVTADIILNAGTIEFDGGALFGGEITVNGGVLSGATVDLHSAGSITMNAGSVAAPNVILQAPMGVVGPNAAAFAAECFVRGTRIATPAGERAVELLVVGDCVLLASGDTASIVWIGQREVVCRRHPKPRTIWPVRICRDAFGAGMPARDILLSPDHAVFAEGVLIPVKYLIDNCAIRQVRRAGVQYFHVELPRHDILLAEGLPVESYLDVGSRRNFANGGEALLLYPDFSSLAREGNGCAPLVITGPAVDAVRRRLAARRSHRRRVA